MKILKYLFTVLITLSLSNIGLTADKDDNAAGRKFGIGIKASTLGAGIDAQYKLNDKFTIRLAGQGWQYDKDETEDGVDYEAKLDLLTIGPMVDWHPWAGTFRVTGGLFYNGNELTLESKNISGSVQIGNTSYTINQLGKLNGELEFNSVAPYLGIGWGNAFRGSPWTFTFDIGAIYQGKGDINLTATGPIATNAAFQADLNREIDNLEKELDSFKFYPVLSLGLSYSF